MSMVIWKALFAAAAASAALRVASAFMPAAARSPTLWPVGFGGIARSSPSLPLRMAPADPQSAAEAAKAALEPLLVNAISSELLKPAAFDAVQVFGYLPATEAADRLARKSVSVKAGLKEDGDLVQRVCFQNFNSTVKAAIAAKENYATLVYGPRGVGKSCMVSAGLQGMRGVITANYKDGITDVEAWLDQVITRDTSKRTEARTAGDIMIGDRVRAALATYLVEYRRRAVIIIEINSQVTPPTLCNILLAAKQLGFEESLATFVIVVSASRSALGLTIGLKQLRARGYSAPDFTEAEAHQYIRQHLPAFSGVAASITSLVGERAVDLVEVCEACRSAASAEECVERAHDLREVGIEDAQDTLSDFLDIARKNAAFSYAESVAFFERLLAGAHSLKMSDACAAFGFGTTKALLTALAESHAFVIDPFTRRVGMQSKYMQIAMEQYLAAQVQQHAKQQQQAGEQ